MSTWTQAETAKVDGIQMTVSSLAADVSSLAADVRNSLKETARHRVAIDGSPENGQNPGLKGRVGSLEQSRKLYRWGLRSLWALVSALVIAGVSVVLAMN